MKLKLVGKVGTRSKNTIRYHRRSGNPIIYANKAGRLYILVRKVDGGVKRLYVGGEYKED